MSQIWNPDSVELFGKAPPGDLVDVTYGPSGGGSQTVQAEQQDEFFRVEMNADNTNGPVWLDFEALIEGIPEAEGSLYVPPQTEMLAYDDDGNLTRDGRWEYRWNGENRLREMETHQEGNADIPKMRLNFAYDNQGRRFKKTVHSNWSASVYQDVETSYFVYDRWNPILAYTISGEGPLDGAAPAAPTHSFVWGLDLAGQRTGREEHAQNAGGVGGLVLLVNGGAGATAANQSFVPGYDGNGNVVAYVNLGTGLPALAVDHDAFGNRVGTEAFNGNAAEDFPIRWSTKIEDEESRLSYYGYKYYAPRTGRWLNRDPIGEEGGLNHYGSVGNDPVNRWDYLGQCDVVYYRDLGIVSHAWIEFPGSGPTGVTSLHFFNRGGTDNPFGTGGVNEGGFIMKDAGTFFAEYELDENPNRKLKNGELIGSPCNCVTCSDVYQCLIEEMRGYEGCGYNIFYSSCRTRSVQALKACCLKAGKSGNLPARDYSLPVRPAAQ